MKVIVATKETQGQRKNDFCHVPEGEILTFGMECDREAVDGKCGCKRALIGTASSAATTTMRVADLPITADDVKAAIYHHLETAGWFKMMDNEKERKEWVDRDAGEMLRLAAYFPAGAILEKRGGSFRARRTLAKAA